MLMSNDIEEDIENDDDAAPPSNDAEHVPDNAPNDDDEENSHYLEITDEMVVPGTSIIF
jgi:hypothetical protein